uniref:Saposin A-type domain-containing protein n=1 Tax=Syphacia muris TaxID=451379 RepID=A0A0N5ADI7_9BILA
MCSIPSDLWCDSAESARQCGVVEQCKKFQRLAKPIRLTLLYETLCPFCQKFITNDLQSLYDEFQDQIEFELVPWGNSRIMQGKIVCDHGAKECVANRLQSCVLDSIPARQALPFIICFEKKIAGSNTESVLEQCSSFLTIYYNQIKTCFNTDRGYQSQIQAARRTMTVRPNPVSEVPYLTINGYSPNVATNNLNIHALKYLLKKWLHRGKLM